MLDVQELVTGFKPDKPLLLVDADEVLLRFVERLEAHLSSCGYELRLTSFQLAGNIFELGTGVAVDPGEVKRLIASFFDTCSHDVPLVPGAADALKILSHTYNIAVLSNIPGHCRERREQSLIAQGVNLPVLSNSGEKGPVAAQIASLHGAPVVFIDDLPPQHKSVARHAPDIHRVHFVADPRLAAMIEKAEHAHVRLNDWAALTEYLHTHIRSL
ncbi:hypothetical protein [Kordiimonas sp.]|uniref:hypothetical protein n=1 Tax=Kordiimonas sp. TaxID=1970157 RepID=UPI003A931485